MCHVMHVRNNLFNFFPGNFSMRFLCEKSPIIVRSQFEVTGHGLKENILNSCPFNIVMCFCASITWNWYEPM